MTRSFYLICEVHCLLQHSETTHYNYIVTLEGFLGLFFLSVFI